MTVKILATGLDFLQSGVSATAPVIETIMKEPEKSLHILAYVISDNAKNFLNLLEDAITTKIHVVLVINDLENQDHEVVKKLKFLDNENPNFVLVDFNRSREVQIYSNRSGKCPNCKTSFNENELIFLQQKNSHEKTPLLMCKDEKCFVSNGGNLSPRKMLHAKVIVRDRDVAVVGSANFSWGGMASHYEVGVYLDGDEAETLADMINAVVSSG